MLAVTYADPGKALKLAMLNIDVARSVLVVATGHIATATKLATNFLTLCVDFVFNNSVFVYFIDLEWLRVSAVVSVSVFSSFNYIWRAAVNGTAAAQNMTAAVRDLSAPPLLMVSELFQLVPSRTHVATVCGPFTPDVASGVARLVRFLRRNPKAQFAPSLVLFAVALVQAAAENFSDTLSVSDNSTDTLEFTVSAATNNAAVSPVEFTTSEIPLPHNPVLFHNMFFFVSLARSLMEITALNTAILLALFPAAANIRAALLRER
jgi:hypothetical protein